MAVFDKTEPLKASNIWFCEPCNTMSKEHDQICTDESFGLSKWKVQIPWRILGTALNHQWASFLRTQLDQLWLTVRPGDCDNFWNAKQLSRVFRHAKGRCAEIAYLKTAESRRQPGQAKASYEGREHTNQRDEQGKRKEVFWIYAKKSWISCTMFSSNTAHTSTCANKVFSSQNRTSLSISVDPLDYLIYERSNHSQIAVKSALRSLGPPPPLFNWQFSALSNAQYDNNNDNDINNGVIIYTTNKES